MDGSLSEYCAVVTGAGGLIGSRLVNALLKKGASVIATDIEPPQADLRCDDYSFIQGELTLNISKLAKLVRESEREKKVLFHMAGISHSGRCEQDPSAAFEANLTLTLSTLEFCENADIGDFVFPSTGILYGDGLTRPAREDDTLVVNGVYAATKLAAEGVVTEYSERAGLTTTIIRFSNIYGAGLARDTVIGTLLAQLKNGEAVRLRDLNPVRDFLYVDDAVEGMLSVLNKKAETRCTEKGSTTIYNISSGVATSIKELALMAIATLPAPGAMAQNEIAESTDQGRSYLVLDNSFIKKETGWSPRLSLRDGLLLSV